MVGAQSPYAVALFLLVLALVVGLSVQLSRRTRSPSDYFIAGGTIPWSVNGLAFVGDYLSAASFLGVGGLIAVVGYDGFLYAVGFVAGWVLALLVVAEPFRRFGRVTFSDVLDARFRSPAVRLTAAVATLLLCVCYLIPQMVGVGTLVTPLLGIPYYLGVLLVGVVVTIIVATSGMASTTYVQCLKGGGLLIVSTLLVIAVLERGFVFSPSTQSVEKPLQSFHWSGDGGAPLPSDIELDPQWRQTAAGKAGLLPLMVAGSQTLWNLEPDGALAPVPFRRHQPPLIVLHHGERETVSHRADVFPTLNPPPALQSGANAVSSLSPLGYLRHFSSREFYHWIPDAYLDHGQRVELFRRQTALGSQLLSIGGLFPLRQGGAVATLDFVSLMLALLCGTAALPHILIRYYTVPNHVAARKSTVLAVAGISLFYVLSLFLGLGAMAGGHFNLFDSNMAIPLLAQSFGVIAFAVVTAIAFAAVLGSASGLIIAASGAVAHDIMDRLMGLTMTAAEKVAAGRIAAVVIGCCATFLGIIFEGVNVSYLAGLVFALAAAVNLPSLIMVLFWRRTTALGLICSMVVGFVGSISLILLSPQMYARYGYLASEAPFALDNPAIIMVPLSWGVLWLTSRLSPASSSSARH